ncbi:MAG TPA: hypothetical protein VME86_07770 [Acidobacteriaceae bacterium]|nr:hypothetical protein [Acidobacteriaceae bacterium]
MRKLFERLPLQFRVLYRQFLLRVVDLEALSIEADIPRFLGQFAGVLIMFSVIQALVLLIHPIMTPAETLSMLWHSEQLLIATIMLVTGLIAVVAWDNIFPDKRDVMVLGPLPVRPRVILLAKVAASGAVLALAVFSLNIAVGIVLPLIQGGLLRFVPNALAYWFTMTAASAFIYGSVLALQGFGALLLPRKMFLRVSGVLQFGSFIFFLGAYFLLPYLATPAALTAAEDQKLLGWSPSFWFFAMFNQLNGTLPTSLNWVAERAWIGLGVVGITAAAALLLCYLRTMKKTVEEPDLVPGVRGLHWMPRFGSLLQSAVVVFSIRSLARSKHHRVAYAFYLAIVIAIGFSALKHLLAIPAPRPPTTDYLIATFMMMSVAVIGLRSIFSLPISLRANWVLRTTQISPPERYISATRWALILLGFFPVWLCAALMSLCFRPISLSAAHLILLTLVGLILADLSLIGVSKIPFACSYLPGKTNIQYVFWFFILALSSIAIYLGRYEQRTLHDRARYLELIGILVALDLGVWAFNRVRAKSATLSFEELPVEVITTLGLNVVRPHTQMVATEEVHLS